MSKSWVKWAQFDDGSKGMALNLESDNVGSCNFWR